MNKWKKKVGLKSTIKKKDISKIESISKTIHQYSTTEKTPLVKVTIEVPKPIYKKIKIKVAEEEITMKGYLVGLVKKDMGIQ